MDRPLRIGIAGANAERAWAKDAHVPALAAIDGLTIHAVSARSQGLADAAAAVFGAARAYGDTLEMVRDPDIDIIAVTCKVPEHRAIVLAALEAGKHLYCEWPLGRDFAEAEEMAEAAQRAGVHAAVGLQGANALAIRHAGKLVREGAIGRLLNLRVISPTGGWGPVAPPFYAYLQDKRNGATLATIGGGHTLAAVEAVVGPYRQLAARNTILRDRVPIAGSDEVVERTCPDHMMIIGEHEGGCVSSVEIIGGEIAPLRFELRGTEGMLTINGDHPGGYQCGELVVSTTAETEPQPAPAYPDLSGAAINVAQVYAQLEADIRTGTRTVPNFDTALRLTKLLDTIDAASDQGRGMALEY
ncbi:MAG: Gfo/Idh/MocA family oxidoreductase [Novosphingobium sp.]|nr:Gfo/Idh/MocA family oxidoreductase [Novosphingobium sp.]